MTDATYADAADTQEGQPKARASQYWIDRLKEYRTAIGDDWEKQQENIDKLYSRESRADSADREYSLFWANIEVLKSATYARVPVPVVAPRFKGTKNQMLASTASDMLERCLITTFEQSDINGCLKEARNEFLKYARGTARVRLDRGRDGGQRIAFDHFTACDFAHDPKRNWGEVQWVGFRAWLDLEEGRKRFNEPLAVHGRSFDDVPRKKRDPSSAVNHQEDQAPIWEIWCKKTGLVHFVCEDFDIELDTIPPWLDLSSFWPCPKPAFGTLVPRKLKPVPDIRQYKDQLEEINEYTARIAALSEALRMKGFYPAGSGEVADAIEAAMKATDNRSLLVPISSWAQLGGAAPKDLIIWLPIEQVALTIKTLVELRRVLIDDVYQITGISDIVRGQTEASETATAQQIKAQWGSLRIQDKQGTMAELARDMTRIAGEMMAENFTPEELMEMSQLDLQPQAAKQQAMLQARDFEAQGQPVPPEMQQAMQKPSLEEVVAFLRNDRARGFTIEIETDSTIQPDEDAEKQRRTEFVTAVGGLMQQAVPLVQTVPAVAPFIGEVLKFTAQGFRAGRPLEGAIDQLVQQMGAMAQQAMQAQQQPDPKTEADQKAAESKLQATEAQTQATVTKAQADMAKTQMDVQAYEQKAAFDMQKTAFNAQFP